MVKNNPTPESSVSGVRMRREANEQATPRPWFNDYGKIGEITEGTALGEMDTDADGELVVEAVNAYDRLRRIEAAARASSDVLARFTTSSMDGDGSFTALIEADNTLRAALDSTP